MVGATVRLLELDRIEHTGAQGQFTFSNIPKGIYRVFVGLTGYASVTDTIKVVDDQGRVRETPDREPLRGIQTPQGFLREVLEHAHASGGHATDDAGLVERIGGHVLVVDGDPRAFKVTSALDLAVATALMQDGIHDN